MVSELITWYRLNKRDLPWRKTRDPYRIWLSEIILQQTRVNQGMEYYLKFIERFPDVRSLARASEQEVLKTWQGLGYYSRARNLHVASGQVVDTYGGNFPADYTKLLHLKGVGTYTAAAIASFAFQLRYPVVDGNVFRFLGRYLGIKTSVDSTAGKRKYQEAVYELMGDYPADEFNQAIMEFGALVCKPGKPDCATCPIHTSCYAFRKNAVLFFPVKEKKSQPRDRYFQYLLIRQGKNTFLQKRETKDIWRHLYQFPLIETRKKTSLRGLKNVQDWKKLFRAGHKVKVSSGPEYLHKLSHQTIHARFFIHDIPPAMVFEPPVSWKKIRFSRIDDYPLPRLIVRFLQDLERE